MPDASLDDRRKAVERLGSALRSATIGLVESEVPIAELERATALATELASILEADRRPLSRQASVDDTSNGIRFFGPMVGKASPLAPPLRFESMEGGIGCHVALDRRYEGPPGFVHGGVTGLMIDELLGQAGALAERWGMTASLTITYLRALPLEAELVLVARVSRTEGRKTWITGRIGVVSDPGTRYVEAEGLFITPREERYEQYFEHFTDVDGNRAGASYGPPEVS